MEKNDKQPEKVNHRSIFIIKAILILLCMVVVIQFALIAKSFTSLKALNKKVNDVENEKYLKLKSTTNEEQEHGKSRMKRGTVNTDIKKALIKLEKLEGR